MGKKLGLFILVLHVVQALWAGDGKFAVNKINPLLFINANAVLRFEEETFEVYSADEARYTKHYAITILNDNADDWAIFMEHYDKLITIQDIDGYLYDAAGNEIKRLKNKDINDYSATSDNNLVDDNRIKFHNFNYRQYPYTIEYKVVFNYKNNTMFFPQWMPQSKSMFSVEQSSIHIIAPSSYQVRYKAINYNNKPIETIDGSKKVYTWQTTNLMAIKREKFSPRWDVLVTSVLFGPSNFEVQNYKGNMQSWKDFGLFSYSLKLNRDVLPDNIKQTIHALLDGVNDTYKKVDILYKYVQKNTRYISIQLGVGGWQPLDANFVATKGYGDCKALTNYMYSILKEAGIASIYTKVKAGDNEDDIHVDFPSSQFNHIILCVPNGKDSIWLECTSQIQQTGYLGAFTANRHVLLVDGENSKIVTTPKYGAAQNTQNKKITAILNNDASLQILADNYYQCIKQDDLHGIINYYSKEKIKEKLSKSLEFATYEINSFNYSQPVSTMPLVKEHLQVTISNYASITGKRLFVMPNVLTRVGKMFSIDEERKNDIVFTEEFTENDTVEITIPPGYQLETMPLLLNEQTAYAKYTSTVKLVENKIIYIRNYVQLSGKFSVTMYNSIATFYDKIYKADHGKIVFVKSE